MIRVENVHKTFVLHQQHGVRLPVLADASLTVNAGECVVLHGHSGSGKSTLLRSLYANYLPDSGHIHIRHGDEWVDRHRHPTQGAGSAQNHHRLGQPVSTGDPAHFGAGGGDAAAARSWDAARSERRQSRPAPDPPQRSGTPVAPCAVHLFRRRAAVVNIARGFAVDYPILLLDEPTASLDGKNSAAVVNLIHDAKARGAAIVGIFHDEGVRRQVADRLHSMGMTA